MQNTQTTQKKQGGFDKFLAWVEKAGNKLPEPFMIFIWLAAAVLVLSFIGAKVGFSAVHPVTKQPVQVVNLLSVAGIQRVITDVVPNFTSFAPLGLVLVIMLGVGLCDKTGFFSAVLRKAFANAKGTKVVVAIFFIAICGNVAGDTGNIVIPPLAAMVFGAIGKNPIAGLIAGYAGVLGGFSANLLLGSLDVLLAGFTLPAAQIIDPKFVINPAGNWYFLAVSTFILAAAGTWVTVKIVEPRLGAYHGEVEKVEKVTEQENKALKMAGLGVVVFVVVVVALLVPQNGLLRDPKTHEIMSSGSIFMKGLVPIVMLMFFIPGYIYGKVSGVMKTDKDFINMLTSAVTDMGSFILLAIIMGQFISYFNWSNIGIILAIKGADFLKATGASGPVLMVGFIILSSLINLLMGSASAKWAILAPIFVPMFMLLGYHPMLTQQAFRIGDSITNIVTPLMPYFVMIVAFAKKYDKNFGMGTLIANALPYTITFFIIWTIQLLVWYFLGLPVGPGSPLFL